jgi:hypothetical protein
VKARIQDYCRRYAVEVNAEGLPAFPSGKRETVQHREWMALYRMHRRHATAPGAEIRSLLAVQGDLCAVCGRKLEPSEAVAHKGLDGQLLGSLHPACHRLAVSAEAVGAEALDRLHSYLWPALPPKRRP